MNVCICCHHSLLRHIGRGDVYWYCSQCHQAMPAIEIDVTDYLSKKQKRFLRD